MFQLARDYDEDDRSTVMDTYCICTDKDDVVYGGVERMDEVEEGLMLTLSSAAAEELGLPEVFRIRLAVPQSERIAVIEGLRRILSQS